jgi:hypothetical protein
MCTYIFVNGVVPDLEDVEVSMCTCIFVNGIVMELVAIALNDVELAVVIVGGSSCIAFAEHMKLFDDKIQIRNNITTKGGLNKALKNLILLIVDKYDLSKSTYCSIFSYKVYIPCRINVHIE